MVAEDQRLTVFPPLKLLPVIVTPYLQHKKTHDSADLPDNVVPKMYPFLFFLSACFRQCFITCKNRLSPYFFNNYACSKYIITVLLPQEV